MDAANVVDSLLDITKTPRKPQYKMAAELPLILRSCLFDKADFMCSSDASRSLTLHLNDEYHHYMLQAEIFHEALSCLPFPESNSLEKLQKKRNHIPLLSRQTERKFPSFSFTVSSLHMQNILPLLCFPVSKPVLYVLTIPVSSRLLIILAIHFDRSWTVLYNKISPLCTHT